MASSASLSGASPHAPGSRPRLGWELGASLGLHLLLAAGILIGSWLKPPSKPLFDPDQVMIVSAVALPRQMGAMPDRPSRTPDVAGAPQEAPPADAPQGSDAETPPPPTSSDMSLRDPTAPEVKGQDKPQDRSQDRDALLRQLQRENLVKDPGAPLGPTDTPRTAVDGVDWDQAIFGTGGEGINDPELARWKVAVETAIRGNWTPLPSTTAAHPEYVVYVVVPIAADGKVGTPEVYKGTPDSGFNRSAIMAVMKTGRVPAPPAKWKDSTQLGVVLEFPAKAKN